MLTFFVTASHPTGYVSWDREPVQVRQGVGIEAGFYAMHGKLGCGKTYGTAGEAIKGICAAHSITVNKIEAE